MPSEPAARKSAARNGGGAVAPNSKCSPINLSMPPKKNRAGGSLRTDGGGGVLPGKMSQGPFMRLALLHELALKMSRFPETPLDSGAAAERLRSNQPPTRME